jgi:hypothetical protein
MAAGTHALAASPARIRGPLTSELADPASPVRRFLDERFGYGLRDVQRRYREAAPALVVPAPDRQEVAPGTLGTAADWLLRFLLEPTPSLQPASTVARVFGLRTGMSRAFTEMAAALGLSASAMAATGDGGFDGPMAGSDADPEYLARACWVLALFTEMFRAGPTVTVAGPLAQFRFKGVSVGADELLSLAPEAALSQLAAFRRVFETALIPRLATWQGRWHLGPTFTGSELLHADADLIAAGLLLDLKTSAAKPSLARGDMFQVIGYALLDFDDAYQLTHLGIVSARYAYLTTWPIQELLDELAGHPVRLPDIRDDFRHLLLTHR